MESDFPLIGYADAQAAVDGLCDAFGFERHAVHDGEGGRSPTANSGSA